LGFEGDLMTAETPAAKATSGAIGDASRPGELVRVGGGWSIVSYARAYALAAHRLASEGELVPVAMPLFFLIRHSIELALKDILCLIDVVQRDEATLDAYDAAGTRAVEQWANGVQSVKEAFEREEKGLLSGGEAEELAAEVRRRYAQCGRRAADGYLQSRKSTLSAQATAALNDHKLLPLLDALTAHRPSIPSSWRELVLEVEKFELGHADRARFSTVRVRKGKPGEKPPPSRDEGTISSLPGFREAPVEIPIANLLAQLAQFIRESVDTDIDEESVVVELYYEGQSASNRLCELDVG
jgi:hypothetical protein